MKVLPFTKTLLMCLVLVASGSLAAGQALAEMRVLLKDGRTMTLPVQSKDIVRIEFVEEAPKEAVDDRRGGVPCIWTGQWSSDWGQMEFKQKRNKVIGTYTHDRGKIRGKVRGNKLTGTWSEAPSYSAPNDAGEVQYTMAGDCRSFTGRWRYGSEGQWQYDWKASR